MIRGDGYFWMRWKPYSVVLGSYARKLLTYFHLKWDFRCDKNISQWKPGEPVTSENMASAPSMTNQPLVRWRFETGIRSYSFWVRLLFDTWLWGMRKTMAAMVFVSGSRVLMFWSTHILQNSDRHRTGHPPFWFRQMENCKSKVVRTRIWTGDHWHSSMNSSYSFEKTVFNYILYIDNYWYHNIDISFIDVIHIKFAGHLL